MSEKRDFQWRLDSAHAFEDEGRQDLAERALQSALELATRAFNRENERTTFRRPLKVAEWRKRVRIAENRIRKLAGWEVGL